MTRNGTPTGCEMPSTVTLPSSMTSSSADCVFGLARLISSASTMLAKTGPAWNSNAPDFWSYTVMPVMSPGSRSGVNWMRVFVPCTDWASARASEVLPVPGTSSSSTWPSLSIARQDEFDRRGACRARPARRCPRGRRRSERTGWRAPARLSCGVLRCEVGERCRWSWCRRRASGGRFGAHVAAEGRGCRRRGPIPGRPNPRCTPIPATRTAPTGTVQVPGESGEYGAQRVVVDEGGGREGDGGLRPEGELDESLCSTRSEPPAQLCSSQRAHTWYGALPGAAADVRPRPSRCPRPGGCSAPDAGVAVEHRPGGPAADSATLLRGSCSVDVGGARMIHRASVAVLPASRRPRMSSRAARWPDCFARTVAVAVARAEQLVAGPGLGAQREGVLARRPAARGRQPRIRLRPRRRNSADGTMP